MPDHGLTDTGLVIGELHNLNVLFRIAIAILQSRVPTPTGPKPNYRQCDTMAECRIRFRKENWSTSP